MKLIHCADLHLDSRMERNLTGAQARERNGELCATFARLVRYARENQVAAVLIAGDLFDTRRAESRTVGFVLDQMRSAPETEFFYLRGNHDEGQELLAEFALPENLVTFGPRWVTHRRDHVTISGVEPDRGAWEDCYELPHCPEETVNIVMLHGQVATRAGEEMIALPKLRGKNIDYLALGHIHSYQLQRLDSRGLWCYPGCLEGRGFDECGERGFVLLEIQGGEITPRFVPFATRQIHEVDVDITGCATVSQMLNALTAAAEEIPSRDLVKFVLRGEFTPETQKDPVFLRKMLEGNFYHVKVRDETRLQLRPEDYEHDASLKGEFIRTVLSLNRPREELEQIILLGLRALRGEEVDP